LQTDTTLPELIQSRVLVVEDDPVSRLQLQSLLARFIAEVRFAVNGEEGLEIWRQWQPNVIVTDILMPVMGGLEMSAAIKATDPRAQIVVVTSDEDSGSLRRALDIGVERYITKPIDIHLLMDAVRKCIRDREQSDELQLVRQVVELTSRLQVELEAKQQVALALEKEKQEQQVLIRKLEEAHNQLLQSEKMASLGQLAAGVAHEINNPIGFVTSNLGTLRRYAEQLIKLRAAYEEAVGLLAEDSPVRQAIVAARQAAEADFLEADILSVIEESSEGVMRVRRIVQDLKTFSHTGPAEWQWIDLNACLDSTLSIANNEIKYTAQVVREYGVVPEVECMASQLNQVFLNLLVNAAQAIVGHGTITLRTGSEAGNAWVEIEDTGSGIPAENLNRIFDPFFTTKPVGKGTGLGLSISYGIVRKHNGHIAVRSSPGQGTNFRVTIPLQQHDEPPAGSLSAAAHDPAISS
jgi:two-component system NtrC family sensor kinase